MDRYFDGKKCSARVYNILTHCLEISTLKELSKIPPSELLRQPNFGKISLNEVNAMLGLDQKLVTEMDLREIKNRFFKCLSEMEDLKKKLDGLVL